MADGLSQNKDPAVNRMQTLLTTFRQVGLPLLQAVTEAPAPDGNSTPLANLGQVGALIDSTVHLSQQLASQLGANEDALDPWVRWALAGASSQIVAANFKATGKPMSPEEAAQLAGMTLELQSKFKAQIPSANEPVPNTVATFRAKMMEALVPVVGAVAQYAFGRSEHALLAEVSEKLIKNADQITRALAPSGSTPEQWRLLCWNVLKAAGQIYTESHYAEADRLLYMNPDERAAYFAQHGQAVPMTQVWQAFNQRMAMLATLITYLEVPPSAQIDVQGWPT